MRLISLQFHHVPFPFFHTAAAFFSCFGAESHGLTVSSSAGPSPSSHYLRSLLLPCIISVDWDVSEDPCSDPLPVLIVHLLLEPWLLVQGPWRSHQWRPKKERPWVIQPFFRGLSLNHLSQQVHVSIYILTLQKHLWLPLNFVAHFNASWVLIFPTSFLCAQCCFTPSFVVCLCFHSCIQILCKHKVLENAVLIFYKHEFLESKLQHEEGNCLCS